MRLTFEQTQGTRTFYFPLDRDSYTPPEFTVVITPDDSENPDSWRAGIAVCSFSDKFSKERGRIVAFGRLHSQRSMVGSANEIGNEIVSRLTQIEDRHYGYGILNDDVREDLGRVFDVESLIDYFTKKDENRKEQNAQVA